MRGALGTALEDKSETVIKVELDEKDKNVSIVSCQYARNKAFDTFEICFDEMSGQFITRTFGETKPSQHPSNSKKPEPFEFSEEEHFAAIHNVFTNMENNMKVYITQGIMYNELIKRVQSLGFSENKSRKQYKYWMDKGWVEKVGSLYFSKIAPF